MSIKAFLTAALLLFAVSFSMPQESSAVPAFSRQTGLSCTGCHFMSFPELNNAGRDFKAAGFTRVGGQSLIEGDFLSIPVSLNASLVTNIRYQKRNGDADEGEAGALNKGELQFPDEAALFLGGRAGNHAGFILELSLLNGDSRFTSFKVPFVFNTSMASVNIIPFTTDNHGAAYGFELLNTGAVVNQRPIEHIAEVSAQQYINTGSEATGIAFAAANKYGFANYTIYAPVHGTNAAGPYLHYARVAVTPVVGVVDIGVGAQVWAGKSKTITSDDIIREKGDAWAVDAQVQSQAGALPIGLYASYALAKKSNEGLVNIYNPSANKDRSAWAVLAKVGVIPNRLFVSAGYRAGRNGDPGNTGMETDNATTVALTYNALQNIVVQLNNSWYNGDGKPSAQDGNMLTTLLLTAAF